MDVAQHPIHRCYQEWQETGTAPCDPVVALRENQPEGRRDLDQVLLAFEGAMILVSHDEGFVAEIARRGMLLADGRLGLAEIHSHPHSHAHPHLHPVPRQ